MIEPKLSGQTILVVEDEYLLADDLCRDLGKLGATVIGPAATMEQGVAFATATDSLTGAILDVNLRGEPVFALADTLIERGVPIVFTTGYDASIIPARYDEVPRCEKPVRMANVVDAIGPQVHD